MERDMQAEKILGGEIKSDRDTDNKKEREKDKERNTGISC